MGNGKIVIGFNDRDEARDALSLGRELADVRGDPMLLVAAFPYDETRVDLPTLERYLSEDGDRLFAGPKEELGDMLETRAIGDRSPARVLNRIAEDEPASVLVVGSTHRGPVGQVLPGSVGERLLDGSPCPVAVAPRGFAERDERSLRRLAVAFDGSRQSWRALAFTGDMAVHTRSQVDLVGVLEPWGSNASLGFRIAELNEIADIDEVDRGRRDDLQRRLDDGLAELPEAVRGSAVLLEGDPAEEVARWASAEQVDLLIVGSRGYGPVKRVLLGDVSARLARSAPCPLVIVPGPS